MSDLATNRAEDMKKREIWKDERIRRKEDGEGEANVG